MASEHEPEFDEETGELIEPKTRRKHEAEALESYYRIETKREIFKRPLSAAERRIAAERASSFEMQRDSAKERGKASLKFIATAMYSEDAVTRAAREDEVHWRKKIAQGEAAIAEARRFQELRAAANGYAWDEVETVVYADDYDHAVFVVRLDTMEEVSRRRMTEYESQKADERRQQKLFGEH